MLICELLLFSGHDSKLDYCNTNNLKEPLQLTLNVNNNQLMSRSLKCKMTESLQMSSMTLNAFIYWLFLYSIHDRDLLEELY